MEEDSGDSRMLCLIEVLYSERRDSSPANLSVVDGNYKMTSWVTRCYGDRSLVLLHPSLGSSTCIIPIWDKVP